MTNEIMMLMMESVNVNVSSFKGSGGVQTGAVKQKFLNWRWKVARDWAAVKSPGSSFHGLATVVGNALSPVVTRRVDRNR